jgi:hypothetical protein
VYIFSKVDEYGFERPGDFDYETYEDFMSQYLIVLAERAKKWAKLIGEGKSLKRSLTVKRYVRKGIPGEHRGLVSTRNIRAYLPDFIPGCCNYEFFVRPGMVNSEWCRSSERGMGFRFLSEITKWTNESRYFGHCENGPSSNIP